MNQPSFEWYYIDTHCHNGYDIVFTLHTIPFMSVFEIAIWDLFVYKDNRPYLHRFFTWPRNRMQRQNAPLLLQADKYNYLQHDRDSILLSFKEKDIELKLKLIQDRPVSYSAEKNLLPDPAANAYFEWVVFSPLCTVEGRFRKGNEVTPLHGLGYHDYNTGNVFLKSELKQWKWNKLYFEDRLLIVGNIEDRSGKSKIVSALAADGTLQWPTNTAIEKHQNTIRYFIDDNEFVYEETKIYKLDDIRFFTCPAERKHQWLPKLRELMAYFSITNPLLKPLKYVTTNVRYKRFRSEGILNGQIKCQTFYEEMYF